MNGCVCWLLSFFTKVITDRVCSLLKNEKDNQIAALLTLISPRCDVCRSNMIILIGPLVEIWSNLRTGARFTKLCKVNFIVSLFYGNKCIAAEIQNYIKYCI